MSDAPEHRTVHTQVVEAPPEVLYDLIADVSRWPVMFGPSLHADILEAAPGLQRFQLWALVNDVVLTWSSRRTLDPERLVIDFAQEHATPPIAAMAGEWRFVARPGGTTEVSLFHRFAVIDNDPQAVAWVIAALDRNSHEELAALRRVAELGHAPDDVVMAFEDVVPLDCSPAAAYGFVEAADRWPERLPHVSRVDLQTPQADVQELEMDTVTPDGHTHTTRSIRLCFPDERIVYKQLLPPALLLGHSGAWSFAPGAGDGTVVTSRHVVAIDPAAIPDVLGPGRTLDDARRYAHEALSANSRSTLSHAADHATGDVAS